MKSAGTGARARLALVFCLMGLYLLLAAGVTLMGSGVYRAVTASAAENSTHRTALSYVANQLRRTGTGAAALGDFGGVDALRLTETAGDGAVYYTYIYCRDGALRELYTAADSGLGAADGLALLDLASLEFDWSGELLTVTAGDGSHFWSVKLRPDGGLEEVGTL